MPNKALKKIIVEDTVLSSGVELGVWSTPSNNVLATENISKTAAELGDLLEQKSSAIQNFFSALEKPIKKQADQCALAELLNERLD